MILNKKSTYGMRALLQLAEVFPKGQVTGREISEREQIPKKFLDQLMLALAKGGIVLSRKGSKGGYSLVRPPDQVKLADVVEVLSGPIIVAECLRPDYVCPKKDACKVRRFVSSLQLIVENHLNDFTLQDLVEIGADTNILNFSI